MKLKLIAPGIKKNRLLSKIIYFESIDSTNKYLLDNDFSSGTIALALTQTAGRGKQGAKWVSGKGGLWFSFVINKKILTPYMFVIISSVAVAEVIASYGLKPVIKWPNDILVNGSKICGILIENDSYNGRIVTGIGINLNNAIPSKLSVPVISLKKALGKKADEEVFFLKLVKKLDLYMSDTMKLKKSLIAKWVKNQADIKGRAVNIIRNKTKVKGIVNKVFKDGSVSIVLENGKFLKLKGEVFFL